MEAVIDFTVDHTQGLLLDVSQCIRSVAGSIIERSFIPDIDHATGDFLIDVCLNNPWGIGVLLFVS